jgi:hypothetical protein
MGSYTYIDLNEFVTEMSEVAKGMFNIFGGDVNNMFDPVRFMCLGSGCWLPSHSCGCMRSVKKLRDINPLAPELFF